MSSPISADDKPVAPNAMVAEPSAPLPPSPEQEASTDAIILASATTEWIKIAVLIARATDGLRAQSVVATPPLIALRIYSLIESGKLDVTGNMRRWRAALVRLKG